MDSSLVWVDADSWSMLGWRSIDVGKRGSVMNAGRAGRFRMISVACIATYDLRGELEVGSYI